MRITRRIEERKRHNWLKSVLLSDHFAGRLDCEGLGEQWVTPRWYGVTPCQRSGCRHAETNSSNPWHHCCFGTALLLVTFSMSSVSMWQNSVSYKKQHCVVSITTKVLLGFFSVLSCVLVLSIIIQFIILQISISQIWSNKCCNFILWKVMIDPCACLIYMSVPCSGCCYLQIRI